MLEDLRIASADSTEPDLARRRGYRAVHLETGAQDFFAPARRLYEAHGFVATGPFGTYVEDPASVFMRLDLAL